MKKKIESIKNNTKKLKKKIVLRKAINPKSEIKEEEEQLNIKENKENEMDFEGLSE